MRSANCSNRIVHSLPLLFTKETNLELFRRICLCRFFELNVKKVYDRPDRPIKMPVYLSLGKESIAAALSLAMPEAYQFGQHRCHDIYLCFGGNPKKLIDELLHLPSGCAKGMGGSASIHSPETKMVGHDGLMGTQIPIAVGFALGSGKQTLAIMGDASAEEDYVLSSFGFAAKKKARVLFICTDNNLSILTEVKVRRDWKMAEVAGSFGLPAVEITDDPWLIMHLADKFKNQLPAFMNIHTCRVLWHAGTGNDGSPEWNRFELVKEELTKRGLKRETAIIEHQTRIFVDSLWQKQLKEADYDVC